MLFIYLSPVLREGARRHEVSLRNYHNYHQIDGLKEPFELAVNTPYTQSVVKMRPLRRQ
jgi:hypothetical protein